MGRFANVFKKSSVMDRDDVLSLPNDISYSQLIHMTKRGFLARKIAGFLEIEQAEKDSVFFLSLSSPASGISSDGPFYDQLVHISEQLLQWMKNGENVPEKVDQLSINSRVKNAILKAYEIHKADFMEPSLKKKPVSNQQQGDKWVIYRDVIWSVTQGKFLLITKDELVKYYQGEILIEKEIKVQTDIPKCRQEAREKLEQKGCDKSELMSWLLVISEAITNTLKHATEGKMTLLEHQEKNEFRVIVEDLGPGFDLENLPKATLMAGYSTKKSLGQGFQLMLKMAKQVLLYTTDRGSTLILVFHVNKQGDALNETGS